MFKALTETQTEELFKILKARFLQNMNRHAEINWDSVQAKLKANPDKLWSVSQMEETGGEPDIIGYKAETDEYLIVDCSAETPKGRRSVCYDNVALEARKENKPFASAAGMASDMGIEILTEEQYRQLQNKGEFDIKTSSWIKTPADIRKLGGALFCDRRYNTVFVYHNGAESYYSVRGFRGILRV